MKYGSIFAYSLMILAPVLSDCANAQTAASEDDIQEITIKGQFTSKRASSATKQDIPVTDTPYSVSAYNESFMKAIETREVADLYQYMTGVARAGNTSYDMTVRGFLTSATDRNAIMMDGLPGMSVRYGSPPTIGVDHIEVVKGPASLLYGQAEPGGFVNIISKKPEKDQTEIFDIRTSDGLGYGHSSSGSSIDGDMTGPLDDNKTLLYRFISQYGYDTGFRTQTFTRPFLLAPSLTWQPLDSTSVNFQLEYRHVATSYDTYLVAPNNLVAQVAPYYTHYQSPTDQQVEDGVTESFQIAHDFGSDIKWNFAYRNVYHWDTAAGFDVVGFVTPSTLQIRARNQLNTRTYEFGDTNFVAQFETVGIKHNLIVGATLGEETLDADRLQFFNIPTKGKGSYTINVVNPSYVGIPQESTFPFVTASAPVALNDRFTDSLAKGAYLSDYITLTDELRLSAGVRYSKETQNSSSLSLPSAAPTKSNNNDTLPQVGLVYEPTKEWTLYSNYSTSFVPAPASSLDITGNSNFRPTTGKSYEVGAKASLWEGRVKPTVAVFQIDKQNVLQTFTGGLCPAAIGTCTQQVGGVRSKGAEFELTMTPVPNWQVIAGYAYTDTYVSKSNIVQQIGAEQPNVPKNAAHLWTRYDIDGGIWSGLGAGLGLAYTSDRAGLLPTATVNAPLTMPSYFLTDVGIYYAFSNCDLTFKITNLFDERYIQSAGFTGAINLLPGIPRTGTLTLRATF